MPLNNQSGGSGGPWGGGGNKGSPWGDKNNNKNNDNKSPWGRPNGGGNNGNNGGGNGGPNPRDIDDLLRKGQQKLKQFGNGFIVTLILILCVLFWIYQSIFFVEPNEYAFKMRFGVPQQEILTDGVHFSFWPIETYRKVPATELVASIGGTDSESLMLTSDQNIVNVTFSLYYNIVNPQAFILNVRDPGSTISRVAESAMREVVGRRPMNDVLRDQMPEVIDDVQKIISETVKSYNLGIEIKNIALDRPSPPAQVIPAFNRVQAAGQERERVISTAKQYANKKTGEATGQSSRIREAANAYKARIVEEAKGRAQRFLSIAEIEKQAPEATRYRLYADTIEKLLSSPNKLIIDKANSGVVPYLPLNNMMLSPRAKSDNNDAASTDNTSSINSTSFTTTNEKAK